MNDEGLYDVVIVGGGLAGLSAAILLARMRHRVLVLEKDAFPRHKVCGEYVSMESRPFLERIGFDHNDMRLPVINELLVTDVRGNEVRGKLPTGGIGVSRYLLDAALAALAQQCGAVLLTGTRADEIVRDGEHFVVNCPSKVFRGRLVLGAWGKRSNIDVKWQRRFIQGSSRKLNHFVGIKYHINYPWPEHLVGLHNFLGGYCGISRIEDGKCCLCYLTTAENLQTAGKIPALEAGVLMKNRWLEDIFRNAAFLYDAPLAISQISFQKREPVYGGVLLLGDSAGVISPLCGNGMSMALRAAAIAAPLADQYLTRKIDQLVMETAYQRAWASAFGSRLAAGRLVQGNFGKDMTTSLFLKTMNAIPVLKNFIISRSAGASF